MNLPELYVGDIIINNDNSIGTKNIEVFKYSKKEVSEYLNGIKRFCLLDSEKTAYLSFNDRLKILHLASDDFDYYIFKNINTGDYHIFDYPYFAHIYNRNYIKLCLKNRRINNINEFLNN